MQSTIESTARRFEGRIQLLAVIVIPVTIFVSTLTATKLIEDAKIRMEYVRIASGILSQKVDETNKNVELREWATAVFQECAEIKLTKGQMESLRSGEARTAPWYDSGSYYDNGGYDFRYDYGGYDRGPDAQQEQRGKAQQAHPPNP